MKLVAWGVAIFALFGSAWPALAGQAEDRQLIEAALKADAAAARAALDAGAMPDAQLDPEDGSSLSPLVAAVASGSEEIVALLLGRGADPRGFESAALALAIQLENASAVKQLIEANGPLEEGDAVLYDTLVMRPSRVGGELLRTALRVEAGFETMDAEALEAFAEHIILEIFAGSYAEGPDDPALRIFAILQDAGAPIAFDDRETDLLLAAARSGDLLMIDALREVGVTVPEGMSDADLVQAALVGAAASGNLAGLRQMIAKGADPSAPSYNDAYALPQAVMFNREETMAALIAAGVDVDLYGSEQESAVQLAAAADRVDIVKALIDAGADLSLRDEEFAWPLRAAVRRGATDSVRLLVEGGAPVNETDDRGFTVLHDLRVSDNRFLGARRPRRLYPNHLDTVELLGKSGFDFDIRSEGGATAIGTLVVGSSPLDPAILDSFVRAGSPVAPDLLSAAVDAGRAEIVGWALAKGASPNSPPGLVMRAAGRADGKIVARLLEAGADLPVDANDRARLMVESARNGHGEVVALLLARGMPADVVYGSRTALGSALSGGNAAIVGALAEAGATTAPVDPDDGSVLHLLIAEDVEAERRGQSPRIRAGQQQALGLLIENGFDMALENAHRQTVDQIAQGAPGALSRWQTAIGLAGTSESDLHRAVRSGDLNAVATIIADGGNIDELDGLGRSALTLSLQLGRMEIADRLLMSGAEFTLEPRNAYQRADIFHASDDRLASAFTVRLMSQRLLTFDTRASREAAEATQKKFATNAEFSPDNATWTVACIPCSGSLTYRGDQRNDSFSIVSTRRRISDGDRFALRLASLQPVRMVLDRPLPNTRGSVTIEFTFDVRADLTIPACKFDFADNATCYPEIEITNPNTPSDFRINTSNGPIALPGAVMEVVQAGETREILPGASLVMDRSRGPVKIRLRPVQSKIFAFHFEVLFGRGPAIEVETDLDRAARAKTYGRIAVLADQLDRLSTQPGANAELQAKTLATAIRVHSAGTVTERYPDHVRELLRHRATEIAALDNRVIELRNAIIAQESMTAGEIDLLIVRLQGVLAQAGPAEKPALEQILAGLQRAQEAAASSSSATRIFRENFFSDIDRVVRDYQALILEYAQYARPAEYDVVLSRTVREGVKSKLAGGDILIEDGMLNDQGANLRRAFGLPTPSAR